MELVDRVKIVGLGLVIDKDILVLGDMHVGYDEALNRDGVLIPRFHFKELMELIQELVKKTNPQRIILNGDIKHEFGTISNDEWRHILSMIDFFQKQGHLQIIKGNHDAILQPIANKRNVELVDHVVLGDIYICHGHAIPTDEEFKQAKTIIMGHEHPAITLDDGVKREKYKCFLKGTYEDKTLIVMPSLNPLQIGSDVTQERLLSPFLKRIGDFELIIIEDKPYLFGKVKQYI